MKVINQKTLWKGKFIKAAIVTYKDHKGNIRNWEVVERLNCDGVVIIVPVTRKKEMVLIRQFRPAINNFVIEFPAGLIDKGEDILIAGKRELIEETGYDSDNFSLIKGFVMSTGIDMDMWNVVLARDVFKAPSETLSNYPPDESEDIETFIVNIDSVYDQLSEFNRNGDSIDLRIYGLLELTKRMLNLK